MVTQWAPKQKLAFARIVQGNFQIPDIHDSHP